MNNPAVLIMNKYPEIVYKYRKWTDPNHRNVLLKNQLYLSSPKDFNDPFDCRLCKSFFLLNTDEKIIEYADKVIDRQKINFNMTAQDIKEKRQEIIDRLRNNMIQEQKEQEKLTFYNQDLYYGILSMSADWANILMWGHYSENHKGYCVGFWEEKLRNIGIFGKGGNVNYTNDFPAIDPLEDDIMKISFITTHTKATDWQYEKEYRLEKLFFHQIPSVKDRVITIPDSCFAEIILGIAFPENEKSKMIELAKIKQLPLYQVKKVPFKFELQKERIH